ncbi:MAG: hypothetical protein IKB86_03270 [Clostridia bacterium]|nr:hypothetical protein [Clostridia bacterium]MBR6633300.1 hypothetical protein [Clostridia bacterium]
MSKHNEFEKEALTEEKNETSVENKDATASTEELSIEEQLKMLQQENESLKRQLGNQDQTDGLIEEFLSEYPLAERFVDEICLCLEENPDLEGKEGLIKALASVLCSSWRDESQLAQDEKFLNNYVFNNQQVRKTILEDYLNEIASNRGPVLTKSGALPKTKMEKPQTIRSAGELARALFRK